MRILLSRRTWLKAGILCLPCLLGTGCKSTTPGFGWLSWSKPNPPSAALSSNIPTKPSINSLPSPSSALGGTGQAANPAGMAYNSSAAPPAANGYYTGPYGMSGQSPAANPAIPNTGLAGNGFGGSAASAPAAYGGYQSTYGAAAGQPGSAYRTADTRNAAAAPAASGGYYGGSSAAGANAWNNEQWGRSASQPAGYSESVQPPPVNSNPSIPSASYPSTSTSTGGFRPGSTGRNTGALTPSLSASPALAPSSVYPASAGYPAASSPASLYPETDATRSSSSTGYAGGYSYPSTTQMR